MKNIKILEAGEHTTDRQRIMFDRCNNITRAIRLLATASLIGISKNGALREYDWCVNIGYIRHV